jgi:hypothetical protein
VIGRAFRTDRADREFDLIPLPHPSGASPWHKIPPGRELTARAMRKIARHPSIVDLRKECRLQTPTVERTTPNAGFSKMRL